VGVGVQTKKKKTSCLSHVILGGKLSRTFRKQRRTGGHIEAKGKQIILRRRANACKFFWGQGVPFSKALVIHEKQAKRSEKGSQRGACEEVREALRHTQDRGLTLDRLI